MSKTLYRVETQHRNQGWLGVRFWDPLNPGTPKEWFDSLDECAAVAIIEDNKDAAGYAANHGKVNAMRLQFRVTDHIGNVHWKGEP